MIYKEDEAYVPHKQHNLDFGSSYFGSNEVVGPHGAPATDASRISFKSVFPKGTTFEDPDTWMKEEKAKLSYKYDEDKTLAMMKEYIDNTYKAHYQTDSDLQCVDVWIALGDSLSTFRNTVMKYLWRVGKKGEYIQDHISDVKKAMHYCMFMLYVLEKEAKDPKNNKVKSK